MIVKGCSNLYQDTCITHYITGLFFALRQVTELAEVFIRLKSVTGVGLAPIERYTSPLVPEEHLVNSRRQKNAVNRGS